MHEQSPKDCHGGTEQDEVKEFFLFRPVVAKCCKDEPGKNSQTNIGEQGIAYCKGKGNAEFPVHEYELELGSDKPPGAEDDLIFCGT